MSTSIPSFSRRQALGALAALASPAMLSAAQIAPEGEPEPGTHPDLKTYCFALFFGSQSQPRRAKYSHTFCTLVLAQGIGDDFSNYALQQETISWLPATLNVRPLAPHPEKGVNLTLNQTLRYVRSNNENIRCWGPYQARLGAFVAVQQEIALLRSGRILYQAADAYSRSTTVKNCFHAVSDLDREEGRSAFPLREFGFKASERIVRHLHRHGRVVSYYHDWLPARMGLGCYCVEYMHFDCCKDVSTPRRLHAGPVGEVVSVG